MKTMEQERAADALECVNVLGSEDLVFKKHYRSYVDRLGPAIVMNGLGQALASERAAAGGKQNDPHRALYMNLQRWLCRENGGIYHSSDLLKAITQHDEAHYLRAQVEALAWLEWHKKFCRADLPREDAE